MPANAHSTVQSVGLTFIIAVALLGIGALVQIGAVGWAFVARLNGGLPTAPPPCSAQTDSIAGPLRSS